MRAVVASSVAVIFFVVATSLVSAGASYRGGVIIYAVGDAAVSGRGVSAEENAKPYSYSFRRYLYHHLQSQGLAVRFVGTSSDCEGNGRYKGLPPLDFDSHHQGYNDGADTPAIADRVNHDVSKVEAQKQEAVKQLKELLGEDGNKISIINIIISGAVDALEKGRNRQDISDNQLNGLVSAVERTNNGGGGAKHQETIIVPSPPPGGKKQTDPDTGVVSIARDWNADVKYEDYRFFLTWRGNFFERRKIAVDCFSSFDFQQHYLDDGSGLNHLGDQALALCIADHLRLKQWIPPLHKGLNDEGSDEHSTPLTQCRDRKTFSSVSPRGGAAKPTMLIATVSDPSVPLAAEIAPVVAQYITAVNNDDVHASCVAGGATTNGAADGGTAKKRSIDDDDDDSAAKKAKRSVPKNDAARTAPEADTPKCRQSLPLAKLTGAMLKVKKTPPAE